MRNVLESTTIIDHYPAVIDRYFKHRHSIHKGPFHTYIYIYYVYNMFFSVSTQKFAKLVALGTTRIGPAKGAFPGSDAKTSGYIGIIQLIFSMDESHVFF